MNSLNHGSMNEFSDPRFNEWILLTTVQQMNSLNHGSMNEFS